MTIRGLLLAVQIILGLLFIRACWLRRSLGVTLTLLLLSQACALVIVAT